MTKKALSKIHKQLKKRGNKLDSLHENSRNAQRLRRASGRDDKLAKAATTAIKGRQGYIDRVTFFQEAAGDETMSDDDMVQLIAKYLTRHTSELTQLRAEHRKGRPPSRREETLAQREESETKEFATGFWVPDMGDEWNLTKLKTWNREWSAMSTLRFVRISKDAEKKESSFPPKGLS